MVTLVFRVESFSDGQVGGLPSQVVTIACDNDNDNELHDVSRDRTNEY